MTDEYQQSGTRARDAIAIGLAPVVLVLSAIWLLLVFSLAWEQQNRDEWEGPDD